MAAGLTSLGGRRRAIQAVFQEARVAASYAHAAHLIYVSDSLDGVRQADASQRLVDTMVSERNAALVSVRRALSHLSVFSRDFEPYAEDIGRIRHAEIYNEIVDLLDREQRRALRWQLAPGRSK